MKESFPKLLHPLKNITGETTLWTSEPDPSKGRCPVSALSPANVTDLGNLELPVHFVSHEALPQTLSRTYWSPWCPSEREDAFLPLCFCEHHTPTKRCSPHTLWSLHPIPTVLCHPVPVFIFQEAFLSAVLSSPNTSKTSLCSTQFQAFHMSLNSRQRYKTPVVGPFFRISLIPLRSNASQTLYFIVHHYVFVWAS